MELTYPTVHLNGSSKDDLVRQQRTARRALQTALDTLQQASPHGRDYYVQGPDALRKAMAAHEARIAKVQAVIKELSAIEMNLLDQGKR